MTVWFGVFRFQDFSIHHSWRGFPRWIKRTAALAVRIKAASTGSVVLGPLETIPQSLSSRAMLIWMGVDMDRNTLLPCLNIDQVWPLSKPQKAEVLFLVWLVRQLMLIYTTA